MVSLGSNNGQSGSYFGFSDERPMMTSSDDDLIIDHLELVAGPEVVHTPIGITWVIILTKILYIFLGVSAYVVPIVCPDKASCGEDPLTLTLYIHGGMWFLLFLLDRYFLYKHTASRLRGYLQFYRETKDIKRLPFMINSCANAMMVILVQVLSRYCSSDTGQCLYLSKQRYVQILVSLECVLAVVGLAIYLVRICKFNRKQALPDVTQDDLMTSFVNSSSDVGYRAESHLEHVMEKQADMIRFLRQHSENLARRNLAQAQEISKLKGVRREGSVHGQF